MPGIAGGEDGEFVLRVKGDSMKDAGILEGDHVIVRRQDTATDGEIVVALVGEEARRPSSASSASATTCACSRRTTPRADPHRDVRCSGGWSASAGGCREHRAAGRRPGCSRGARGRGRAPPARRSRSCSISRWAPRAPAHDLDCPICTASMRAEAAAARCRTSGLAARTLARPRRRLGVRRAIAGAAAPAGQGGSTIDGCRPSSRGEVGETTGPSRKVRTPQGRVVGEADPGKPAGKCHRNTPPKRRASREPGAGKGEMVR